MNLPSIQFGSGSHHFGEQFHLIDGKAVPALSGETIDVRNPATCGRIATIARGGDADIDRAVAAARRAFEGSWSSWTPRERQALLLRVCDLIEQNFDELSLIETLDVGAPLSRTRAQKGMAVAMIRFYATQVYAMAGQTLPNALAGDITTMTMKAPAGVVGGIIPWNGPLLSQWWIIGPALATGCTVVLKPAEDASLSVRRVAELLLDAGVPSGVVNVVTGYGHEAGAALAAHMDVDRVAFTGSTETARKIIAASAGNLKRLQLELGGKSPDIVFADADLDLAVPGAAMGVFRNSGQMCYAGSRLFVERPILEPFLERLADHANKLVVGDGLDPATELGPLISQRQLDRVMGFIAGGPGEGARLVAGGNRLGGELASGYFVRPTVFADVHNDMRIAREEIFGPVISVIPFDDTDEVLRLANDTQYGLGGGVWTRDLSRAMAVIRGVRTGTMWVNCYGLVDPAVGFGGTKLSGYGVKGGPGHVEAFLTQKNVYLNAG